MNNQEQLDDLIIDDLKIYQRQDQFRFSFDAIALVHFCRFNQRHRYIDLGTGTGVLPLIGTSLGAGHITGVEINDVMANMAERSVLYNHKSNVVSIVQGDYRTMNYQQFGSKPFDGVLVNPPFLTIDEVKCLIIIILAWHYMMVVLLLMMYVQRLLD